MAGVAERPKARDREVPDSRAWPRYPVPVKGAWVQIPPPAPLTLSGFCLNRTVVNSTCRLCGVSVP